jgi:circadian clock protein KaiB
MTEAVDSTSESVRDLVAGPVVASCELTLFVSGASELSARAITNARALCDAHIYGQSRLTVVDVYENSEAGLGDTVLATPTLVRSQPLPERKIVGDLSDVRKVLMTLELRGVDDAAPRIG